LVLRVNTLGYKNNLLQSTSYGATWVIFQINTPGCTPATQVLLQTTPTKVIIQIRRLF
ncbi:3360_t:CDS:2, partial [Dentiscutata heterogama]